MNKIFSGEYQFKIGAVKVADLPTTDLPEFCFIGRSNVGKSSLINALTGRKTLAKVSQLPGKTRQLNFFTLANMVMIVDLPGYGYARASKEEIGTWNKLIYKYLQQRRQLTRAFLLIDSRHGVKNSDEEIMRLLDEYAVSYQIVLTKLDKITQTELVQRREELATLAAKHPAMHPKLLETSSTKREGLEDLQAEIAAMCHLA
jgi:GTP-binding protein